MIIQAKIPKDMPSRNIGTQIAKIYSSGVPEKALLFYFTLPVKNIFSKKFSVLKYDHTIETDTKTIGLIKIKNLTYKSADGQVVLENQEGAGFLYFVNAALAVTKKRGFLEIWTQEILGVSDDDSFEIEIEEGMLECQN